jgi:hypothetical protein
MKKEGFTPSLDLTVRDLSMELLKGIIMFPPTRQHSNIITSVDELSEILGDNFVLFLGSAVSGKMAPWLPMAYPFFIEVMKKLESNLSDDN